MNIGCSSGGGAGGCGGTGGGMVGTGVGVVSMPSSPFTMSQWQELEHQALILKYLKAHLPVPPDLVFPIRRSLETVSPRYFHHPTVGYCSFYGKVVDPEPGRCRRTDGKKWRCSKEAYPDSKYCERHMHRGRNRSRKPVESPNMSQSSTSATTLAVSASSSTSPSLQTLPLHAYGNSHGRISGTDQSQFCLESIPYAIPSKDYRYFQELKQEGVEHSFFSEPSGSNRGVSMNDQVDTSWPPMQPRVTTFSAKSTENALISNDCTPYSFYGVDYAGDGAFKQEEDQSAPRQFFDEWPKTRETWSGLEEDSSNQTSFSTTQLSISIPLSSSDLSTSSRSPHGS